MAKPTLQGWLRSTRDRVQSGISQAVPAWELWRQHRPTLRAWVRYRGAVEEILGPAEAEAYTALLVEVARTDGAIARILALSLPDQLPRVPTEQRPLYFQLLGYALEQGPAALPLLCRSLPELIGTMEPHTIAAFIREGLTLYTESPQKAESFFRQESEVGQAAARKLQKALPLAEVSRTLGLYARAHCGEDVQLKPGKGSAFSDGHHIYLPEWMDHYGDERDFLSYRVLTALAAGYLEFGTFDLRVEDLGGRWPEAREGEGELQRFFAAFPNKSLARDLFQVLEDHRVEARIRAEYPGVARDLDRLGPELRQGREAPSGSAARAVEGLARVVYGLEALDLNEAEQTALQPVLGSLALVTQGSVLDVARMVQQSYPAFDALMRRSGNEPNRKPGEGTGSRSAAPPTPPPPGRSSRPRAPQLRPEEAAPEDRQVEEQARRLWNAPDSERPTPTEARKIIRKERNRVDQGNVQLREQAQPPGGAVVPEEAELPPVKGRNNLRPEEDPDLLPGERRAVYKEWDSGIEDYKPAWVTVREHRVREGSQSYVDEVMRRHHSRVVELRRRFEALRPQEFQRQTRLTDGAELDLDRVVEDRVAARSGGERSDRIYANDLRMRRDVAVAFLLDMSSSTNESADGSSRRIIDVEKEALILAAEALYSLGDSFAVFGFSGYGRGQVVFYVAKDFHEPWNDKTRARVGNLNFKMENRDGAAIRHATARLLARPARARLLMLLSDGKPLDCGCDHYYDRYAQDDTRAALREARKGGVHPFCITVDPSARAYLPRMYGDVAYTVIDRVEQLPAQLLRVYRRMAI